MVVVVECGCTEWGEKGRINNRRGKLRKFKRGKINIYFTSC